MEYFDTRFLSYLINLSTILFQSQLKKNVIFVYFEQTLKLNQYSVSHWN